MSEDPNQSRISIISAKSSRTAFSNMLNEQFRNDFRVHHLIKKIQKQELMKQALITTRTAAANGNNQSMSFTVGC